MRLRSLFAGMAVVFIGALLAGCGGSDRLSASAYRARLATIAKEADKTQADAEQGAERANSVAELQARLKAFAAAEDRLGDEVSGLKPPKDAEAANAELALGEHHTAAAVRSAIPKLAKFTSVKAAIASLYKVPLGGREVALALEELQKLGYKKGG